MPYVRYAGEKRVLDLQHVSDLWLKNQKLVAYLGIIIVYGVNPVCYNCTYEGTCPISMGTSTTTTTATQPQRSVLDAVLRNMNLSNML